VFVFILLEFLIHYLFDGFIQEVGGVLVFFLSAEYLREFFLEVLECAPVCANFFING
jgi:hypothetical protein